MTAYEVRLLVDIASAYRGNNNGDLSCTWSVMQMRGWKSKATMEKALAGLLEKGFLVKTRQGGKRVCSLYAVTWEPIDECGGKLDVTACAVPSNAWRNFEPQKNLTPGGGAKAMLKYEFYPMRRGIGGCFRKSFTPGGGLLLRSTMWFYISCTLEHDNASGELACSGGKCTAKERIGQPTVNFRRSGKPLPLQRPTNNDFGLLWRHINAAEEDRPLVAAWLLSALRPRGPYPIALLIGEQGTGKSVTSRVLKRLTDPSAVMLRPPPREDRDLQVASSLVAFMSARDTWTGSSSDLLGRLADTSPGAAGSQAWPRSAKMDALRRVAPALRAAGITVAVRKTEARNLVEVCRAGKDVPDVPAETRVPGTSGASGTLKRHLHAQAIEGSQWEGPL